MNNENYITIIGWMRNELGLKGNELLVYALIYGFSQDGDSEFNGSVAYIAEWTGSTKQTVHNALKALCEKRLIEKKVITNKGVRYCTYRTILPVVKKFDGGWSKNLTGVVKKFDGGGQKIRPNNTNDNSIDKDIDIHTVVDKYHEICISLPKVIKVTDARKRKVKARIKSFGVDHIAEAFYKVEASDFLTGRNGQWKANFDWLMKSDEHMIRVLEGYYDNRPQASDNPFLDMLREGVVE